VDFSGFRAETERMVLRPYTVDDYPAMADMHGRAEVARYLMWDPRDADASRQALERHLSPRLETDGDGMTLAGVDKGTGAFVGEFVLFLRSTDHRGGEVGYILHPDFFGKGLAAEGARVILQIGFEDLNLHRIIGRLDARNTASARVLEKLGMRKEAHFVRNELVKGEWSDEVVYAMLAEEWGSSPSSSDISTNTTAPASSSTLPGVSPPANP
jgi:RimJ/RimL family protein N-acetyltransferase